ncbi:MAG TPA: hypothetical protein VHB73_05085, partial [Alphaproteobacteria bacterium]|nr:hypothetical protein [Alphaproteobacteria bacterium]
LERGLSAITLIHDDLHLPPLPPGSTTQELEEALAEIAPPAPAETPAIIPAPAAPAAHMAPQVVVQEVMPEAARVELAALRDELMALRDMLRGQ